MPTVCDKTLWHEPGIAAKAWMPGPAFILHHLALLCEAAAEDVVGCLCADYCDGAVL